MSTDTRELILERILVTAETVPGITTAVRNRQLLSTESRPAIVLLDGDEQPKLSLETRRLRGRAGPMTGQIMTLRPELYILLKEGRPNNETIGAELNAFRIAFLASMWADVTLADLVGPNGNLVYNGCATDLKSGSALSGEMRLDFVVNYLLKPTA